MIKEGWVIIDKEYYINLIALNGHLGKQCITQSQVTELVDKNSSNLTKTKKDNVLNSAWKTSEFYCAIKTQMWIKSRSNITKW